MNLVEALYSYKGKNNDELNFKKGEVITVTQKEEGGWWEGTLNGKTGWFPANYVKEFKSTGGVISTSLPDNGQEIQSKQKSFQIIIMNDITESERNFIKECQNLVEQYLKPLEKCSLLPQADYSQLVANYEEVIRIHNNMLHALEEMMGSQSGTPRFGRVFLSQAPLLKTVHIQYCSSHPKAITIVEKYRDELSKFMETRGAAPPGILTLTTGLSRPFRRLERYATHLQELEKHLEESYPDRGDTQRSAVVFTDLAKLCAATRKERELALEVLSGNVRDWVGENPSALGDIIHLGMATIQPNNLERYFVLFPAQLIILTTSPRLSAFVFDKRIPLCDISANRIVSRSNAFELSGPGIEPITVTCTTKEEQNKWLDLLQQQIRFASKSMALLPVPQVSCPYVGLTRYILNLVKEEKITRNLIRALFKGEEMLESIYDCDPALLRKNRLFRAEFHVFPTFNLPRSVSLNSVASSGSISSYCSTVYGDSIASSDLRSWESSDSFYLPAIPGHLSLSTDMKPSDIVLKACSLPNLFLPEFQKMPVFSLRARYEPKKPFECSNSVDSGLALTSVSTDNLPCSTRNKLAKMPNSVSRKTIVLNSSPKKPLLTVKEASVESGTSDIDLNLKGKVYTSSLYAHWTLKVAVKGKA